MKVFETRLIYITFENFWYEDLKVVKFKHHSLNQKPTNFEIYNVKQGEKRNKAGHAEYANFHDYWFLEFETMSGERYLTKDNFYCDITEEDEEPVILGVNGDAKTMYVAFTHSSGCSTRLIRRWI
ncbi:TPA: hypothetical protein ACS72K_000644 [Providencia alcalifaciens]